MEKTITLTLSRKQAKVIQAALDSYSRLKCGQVAYAIEHLNMDRPTDEWLSRDQVDEIENFVRERAFKDALSKGHYYGVRSHEVSDKARIAYDLIQTIRYYYRNEDLKNTVDNHPPMKTSTTEELPIVKD